MKIRVAEAIAISPEAGDSDSGKAVTPIHISQQARTKAWRDTRTAVVAMAFTEIWRFKDEGGRSCGSTAEIGG
jgi:hypothetical protein